MIVPRVRLSTINSPTEMMIRILLLAAVMAAALAGCGAPETSDANVRRQIDASLQRTVSATMSEDIDAYMAELPPDLEIRDESGEIVTREQQRANVLRDWGVIERTLALTHGIDSLQVNGDTATVLTSQRWERMMLRRDGSAADTVLTTQKHRETWRRTRDGWFGYDIEELGGEIFINGKPYTP
jgi:hypothetical protein